MVVELVARGGDVRRALVERRELDGVDEALGQPLGRDVLPGLAAVARELHQPVVTPRPDHALLVRRFGDVRQGAVVLGADRLVGVGLAGLPLLLLLVARQVWRDRGPGAPEVRRLEQQLRAVVEGVRFVAAPDDRRVPVVAVLHVLRVATEVLDGRGHDVRARLRLRVQHFDRALIAAAQHVARVVRVEGEEGTLAARRWPPAVRRDAPAGQLAARDDHRAVVLLPGVDAVRKPVVRVDAVELRRGLVALGAPAPATVEGDHRPAIVGEDEVVRVVRVDPQVVVVAVHALHLFPRAAAVIGAQRGRTQYVDAILVLRIHEELDVVPGALHQARFTGHLAPALAGVGGDVQPTIVALRLAFDQRVHLLRVGRAHRDGHLAHLFRKAVGHLHPRLAGVGGLVETAPRPAADDLPGQAAVLPHGRVENARIGRIHGQLGRARPLVDEEHLLPGGAAVGGLEDAALGGGRVERALRGDPQHVGVLRVHDDARDVPRVVEPHLLPRLAGVGGAIDAVAGMRHHAAHRVLARAHVDHVRITRRDGNRPDGARLEGAVGDVPPADAHVVGLPDAAAGGAHVVRLRVADDAGGRVGAAAAEGPDGAPLDGLEDAVGSSHGGRRPLSGERGNHSGQGKRDEQCTEHGRDRRGAGGARNGTDAMPQNLKPGGIHVEP